MATGSIGGAPPPMPMAQPAAKPAGAPAADTGGGAAKAPATPPAASVAKDASGLPANKSSGLSLGGTGKIGAPGAAKADPSIIRDSHLQVANRPASATADQIKQNQESQKSLNDSLQKIDKMPDGPIKDQLKGAATAELASAKAQGAKLEGGATAPAGKTSTARPSTPADAKALQESMNTIKGEQAKLEGNKTPGADAARGMLGKLEGKVAENQGRVEAGKKINQSFMDGYTGAAFQQTVTSGVKGLVGN